MQIDWWTLGIQTVNFLIVIWLLSRFLYRPVRRIIDDREAADRKLSDEAQAKAEAADTARQDYEHKMADFAAEQRRREAELHTAMEKERDKVLADAKAAADSLMSETRDRLAREREETLGGIKSEIVALAADLARKALASGVSREDALRQAAEHLDGLPPQELQDLKAELSGAEASVTVTTAADLDADGQAAWRAALGERLGSAVRVDFAADPAILGGTKLQFPHAVLDLSVAQRLKDEAEGIKA